MVVRWSHSTEEEEGEEKRSGKAPPGAGTECERYYFLNYNSIFYPFPVLFVASPPHPPPPLCSSSYTAAIIMEEKTRTAKDGHFANEWMISIRPFFCQN